ncbi:hypothetical protein ACRAWF_47115 [Streptomyces sp. L7]
MDERGIDMTVFSPRASFMAHHVGGFETSAAWAAICNELCHRVSQLYPERFVPASMLPSVPRRRSPATCIPELHHGWAQPKSWAPSRSTSTPIPPAAITALVDRPPPSPTAPWYPLYEKMGGVRHPGDDPRQHQRQPLPSTPPPAPAHPNADTTAFMQPSRATSPTSPPCGWSSSRGGGAPSPYHTVLPAPVALAVMALGKPPPE